MDTSNVFSQGKEFLEQARSEIAQYNRMERTQKSLSEQLDKVRKSITQEEKSIKDEIHTTVKKRKLDIEAEYDAQLVASRKKVKAAQSEKDKEKSAKVSQRKSEETADVRGENARLESELKTLFKKNHVPGFCRSSLYYALFNPNGFKEILILLLCMILFVVGLPLLVYVIISQAVSANPPAGSAVATAGLPTWLTVLIIAGVIVLVLGLYFLVFNLTKVKHSATIAEGRNIRNQINANKKNVRAIETAISKDKDESIYDLGEHDEKIRLLQGEVDEIANQKKSALEEFERVTVGQITDEINGRRLGKVDEMKAEQTELQTKVEDLNGQIKEASLAITDNYTKYLGKNICKEDVLTDIIHIMETEGVATISEGLAIYNGEAPRKSDSTEG